MTNAEHIAKLLGEFGLWLQQQKNSFLYDFFFI